MKSADDLTELNREPDVRGDSQLPPSGEASTAASPSRASIDEMAAVVGRVDADDADFAPLPAPRRRTLDSRDPPQRRHGRGAGVPLVPGEGPGGRSARAPRAGQLERRRGEALTRDEARARAVRKPPKPRERRAAADDVPSESGLTSRAMSPAAPGR